MLYDENVSERRLRMSENRKRYSSAPLYGLKNNSRNQGGGFQVPMEEPRPVQPRPQRQRNFVFLQVCLTLILPILFIVALILGYSEVHWGFVALSCLALLCMWALGAFIPQARKTMTLIYTALMMVSLAAALWFTTSLMQPPEDNTTGGGTDLSGLFGRDVTASDVTALSNSVTNANISPSSVQPQVTPDSRSQAQERLEQFMNSWMNLDYTAMLDYCSPAWKNSKSNPEQAIFKVRGTQTPTQFEITYVSGNDADDSRTITMEALIDRGDGNEPSRYRYEVLMLRVNGQWYVDPDSLTTATKVVNAGTPTVHYTLMPTNSPDPNQILYYNPDGGSYYHTDDNCSSTSIKYLPLRGSFRYSEIANYDLKPCSKCNAPNR